MYLKILNYNIIFLQWISLNFVFSLPLNDREQLEANKTYKKVPSSNQTVDEDTLVLNVLWTIVKRQPNKTDLIRPSLCPSPCDRLFKARRVEHPVVGVDDKEPSEEELCHCRCPTDLPIFLQNTGQCVAKIDGCRRPIRVANGSSDPNSQWAPVVELPDKDEFIDFPGQILWQESRVKLKQKQGPRCNITKVLFLNQERRWSEATENLFKFGWSESSNTAGLIWTGMLPEEEALLGNLVQIKMDCIGAESNAHCLTFRVAGELVFPNYSNQLYPASGSQNRVETVVIILLAILLFFTSFGYLILWKVRWRIKKSKLISALQMQFLYHMKQEKEKASEAVAHHHYQAFASQNPPMYHHQKKSPIYNTTGGVGNVLESPDGLGLMEQPQVNPTLLAKRKLYFSAEFFEPSLMQNPPPMADQFLQDLRKMIDIAKQRINLRKHIQHLGPIAEEPPDIYQAYMKQPRFKNFANEPLTVSSISGSSKTSGQKEKRQNEESSPKSIKSIDSGHESSSSNESKRVLTQSEENGNGISMDSKNEEMSLSVNDKTRLDSNGSNKKSNTENPHERPSNLQLNAEPQILPTTRHEFKKPFDLAPARKINPHLPTPTAQNNIQVQNNSLTNSSRIPIGLTLGQKSPRISSKPLTLTNQNAISFNSPSQSQQRPQNLQRLSPKSPPEEPPPLPPRNNPPVNPPKIVQQFMAQSGIQANGEDHNKCSQNLKAETSPKVEENQPSSRSAEIKRKAYAVFPQDAMLKKSLPRRSKKPTNKAIPAATNTKNGVIETNM